MQRRGVQFVRMVFLLAGSVLFLIPLLWMFSTAIKPIDQTMSMPPRWLPIKSLAVIDGETVEVGVGKTPLDAGPDTPVRVTVAYQWLIELDGQTLPVRLVESVDGQAARVEVSYHWELDKDGGRVPVRLIERDGATLEPGRVDVAVIHRDGYLTRKVVAESALHKVADITAEDAAQSYSFVEEITVDADRLIKRYVPWNGRQTFAHVVTEQREVPLGGLADELSPQWGNFGAAIHVMKRFWTYLSNTLILCVFTVIGTVVSSALVAYGFSRIDWPGRDKVFLIVLGTMMIPFPVVMVPLYSLFKDVGWIGTLRPLWVPSFFAGAFNVFLLRQFFRTIPKELSEAARIDGCSELRTFLQIVLPLARPAITVVALFQFLYTWNDFLGPLIYLTDEKDYTLALALQAFQSQQGGTQWHYLMAASTLVVAPIIFLFFLTQRTFIEGVSMSGLKG